MWALLWLGGALASLGLLDFAAEPGDPATDSDSWREDAEEEEKRRWGAPVPNGGRGDDVGGQGWWSWARAEHHEMVYRPWNRIYVSTHPRDGVVVLLVQAVPGSNSSWAIVDSARNVSVVNLRDRRTYSTRPLPGVRYTNFRPLSEKEKLHV